MKSTPASEKAPTLRSMKGTHSLGGWLGDLDSKPVRPFSPNIIFLTSLGMVDYRSYCASGVETLSKFLTSSAE